MITFRFSAPLLFDAGLAPRQSLIDDLHDAPGSVDRIARTERFALWLRDQMAGNGIAVKGPTHDEDGWSICAYGLAPDGFAMLMISAAENNEPHFSILVVEIGDDVDDFTHETCKTIEAILTQSVEISNLKIEPV